MVKPPGVEGFEDVLNWLYVSSSGPNLLDQSIQAINKILTNSEIGGKEKDGLTAVSRGAALLLKRVLGRLEELQAAKSF